MCQDARSHSSVSALVQHLNHRHQSDVRGALVFVQVLREPHLPPWMESWLLLAMMGINRDICPLTAALGELHQLFILAVFNLVAWREKIPDRNFGVDVLYMFQLKQFCSNPSLRRRRCPCAHSHVAAAPSSGPAHSSRQHRQYRFCVTQCEVCHEAAPQAVLVHIPCCHSNPTTLCVPKLFDGFSWSSWSS